MGKSSKWTVRKIRELKGKRKISVLTVYDYTMARILDEAGLQMLLVGDSLGMTVLGYETTLPVTMEDMLHHTAAVSRGVRNALVIADMPFLSFQGFAEEALLNAGRFLKYSGADAVKVEGGEIRCPVIRSMVENGIPVAGHIGLTPQSVKATGYAVQGRSAEASEKIMRDALLLEESGVFCIVLESVPSELATEITATVSVPTIGIGAGSGCDGQVLVVQDMLGLYEEINPRFVKRYAELGDEIKKAVNSYKCEVESGVFPGAEHSY